jgi:hypothetical protein
MYNVGQPNAAQGQVYDSPAFSSRQAQGGLQMMTPEVASTYFPTETASSSPHGSVQQPNVYQQSSGLGFPTSMQGLPSAPPGSAGAEASVTEEPEFTDRALEERWLNYKSQLASVFEDVSNGALQSASETLSTISTWLLSQVTDLGAFRRRL